MSDTFSPQRLLSIAIAVAASISTTHADVEDRLYDFTDAYYLENGVNPAALDGRRQPGPLAASDAPIFSFQRPVRALLTLPAYDHSGNGWYFTVLAGLSANAFTADEAGRELREIADRSPEYIFPRRGTDPLGLGALRQSVMLDMRHGYFSNNRLGIWIHVWVSYTDRALNTPEGRRTMAELAQRNGTDLDGTPIIASVSEIEDLTQEGFVAQQVRPLNDPLRYAICPVIKDPTDSGIARDQFLAFTRKADGKPLEPEFVSNFECLRLTGDTCDSSNSISGVTAVSRKTHGSAGDFDLPLPLTGNPGIECRSSAAAGGYQIVLQFPNSVSSPGVAAVTSGPGQVQGATVNGSTVTVNLSGLVNAQTTVITLNSVTTGGITGNVSVPIALLVGDTNWDGVVNSGDALQVRSRSGQLVNATTFRYDLNGDGLVNTGDAIMVRARTGTGL